MDRGFDCAAPLTAGQAAAMVSAGYAFAGRYLVPARGSLKWKALTAEEARAVSGAGLGLLCVWETAADRALGGSDAGTADGRQARELAESLGMPESGAVYFAVDFDARDGQLDAVERYLKAAAAALGPYRAGAYGSFTVVEEMYARRACDLFWQCAAWSGGRRSARAQVYQSGAQRMLEGILADPDECGDTAAAGIWSYPLSGGEGGAGSSGEDSKDGAGTADGSGNGTGTGAESSSGTGSGNGSVSGSAASGAEGLTGEEIWRRLTEYLASRPVPEWARCELAAAVALGITDGQRPTEPVPRYQAAIMAKRAAEAKTRSAGE